MKAINNSKSLEIDIKRLLKRRDGTEYVSNQGWTRDPFEASTFSNVLEAAETCIQRDLHEIDLTLRVGPDGCEVFSVKLV